MGNSNVKNIMRQINVDKVTLHCSTVDAGKLDKSIKLLKIISGMEPIKTKATKRIPTFKIRPGLPIGCKVTLRGEKARNVLKLVLETVDNKINSKKIMDGSFSFGVKEYIDIPSIQFQRDIGILGFDVTVTLKRAGYRVLLKKSKKGRFPNRQRIKREETINFVKENLGIEVI